MKWRKWLENWDMTKLNIKTPFLDMEWTPQPKDQDAAWDMYIELLTRITTQRLLPEHGDEKTALESVYAMFAITRQVIRTHGRDCINFSKIAIVVLNQIIRPFTAKWHRLCLQGAFKNKKQCVTFRKELEKLQTDLRKYTKMLSDMAGVEDLTDLENNL